MRRASSYWWGWELLISVTRFQSLVYLNQVFCQGSEGQVMGSEHGGLMLHMKILVVA